MAGQRAGKALENGDRGYQVPGSHFGANRFARTEGSFFEGGSASRESSSESLRRLADRLPADAGPADIDTNGDGIAGEPGLSWDRGRDKQTQASRKLRALAEKQDEGRVREWDKAIRKKTERLANLHLDALATDGREAQKESDDLRQAEVEARLSEEVFNQSKTKPKVAWRMEVLKSRQYFKQRQDFSARQALSARQADVRHFQEKTAQAEAFSTFSLHVSDVSFQLAKAALAQGKFPDAARVRIEEFVNALDYGDPAPSQSERVACQLEQAAHPFLQQRNLMRVALRTAAAGRASGVPLRLTLLLDNSGSMQRFDRQATLRRAFGQLAGLLGPSDQVTLISFARQPRLLADRVRGDKSSALVRLVESLPSEGGTNLEAALRLAFEKAREQQTPGGQSRVILLTDGAVNLGDADPQSLAQTITTMRDAGIAFDAAGIGANGLNDEVLEALTRQGDGRYYLLDRPQDAGPGFARQIAGALRPAAKNVKVQVEFNPQRVGRYKLLGFEKHRLKQEDFRNDKVDAAELAAAEAGVALYQFEAKPEGEGDIGSVSVRFLDTTTGRMVENRWPIPYLPQPAALDQAAPSIRMASVAGLFAAKLRGEPLGAVVDLKTLSQLANTLPERNRNAERVAQLRQMIAQARQLTGN